MLGAEVVAKAIYASSCPNCGGPISSVRLELGLPCSSCIPDLDYEEAKLISELPPGERFKKLVKIISRESEGSYSILAQLHEELDRFEKFFKKCVGKELWSLQRTWAYRMLSGDSFAITAPTGVGKTTLLLIYSLYEATEGTKVLMLVPTESLLRQSLERLKNYASVLGKNLRIIGYTSKDPKKTREEQLMKIEEGDFDILIITTSFLSRRFDVLKNKVFGLIVVDDADSLLKDSANVDRVLVLSGFKEHEISAAMKIIKIRNELYFLKIANRNNEKIESLERELEELEIIVAKARGEGSRGQLLISSATGRQSGIKPKLFKELLGFEVGGIHAYMRNVIDSYAVLNKEEETRDKVLELVKTLGSGGLIFISRDKGVFEAKSLVSYLVSNGIRAELAIAGKKSIEKLRRGEADVLVGVSSYYGVAVRGVDLPEKVRYAIFYGVPKNRMLLEQSLINPRRLLQVLAHLSENEDKLKSIFSELTGRLSKLTPSEINVLRIALMKEEIEGLGDWLRAIAESIINAIKEIKIVLKNKMKVKESISVGTAIIVREGEEEFYLISPDPLTYIQASGRTSRFLNDKMTLGLSIILESNREIIEAFERKMSIYSRNFSLKPLEAVDLRETSMMLDSSRRGGEGVKSFRPAKSLLMVVESPNKAKTIAWYFGRPSRRKFGRVVAYEIPIIDDETLDTYLVTIVATKGHIFDLAIDDGLGIYGVITTGREFMPVYAPITVCHSCGKSFSSIESKCPYCGEKVRLSRSTETIQALRKLALESEEVVIATDPDVEGEKIAWDVYLTLKPFSRKLKRAEFHEVTPDAIINALRNLREINMGRVRAQILRRITDRWIGFPLSTVLKEKYQKPWLGAGRVQTPVLGWTIDRFKKWKEDMGYFVRVKTEEGIEVQFFRREKKEAEILASRIKEAGHLRISSFEKRIEETNPAPPYTTDSLLFDASRNLKFSASFTMKLLQDLFEAGLITYHRTDSTHISTKGISVAREYFEKIIKRPDLFKPRAWGNEGAHEAIRPTKALNAEGLKKSILDGTIRVPSSFTSRHFDLYDLIFRRFISSQARASKLEIGVLKIESPEGDVIEKEVVLKEVVEGSAQLSGITTILGIDSIAASGRLNVIEDNILLYKSSLTPLYSEGNLVKLMKERGIGRPSTYAKIIESLRRHGYVIISKKKSFVIPTSIGIEAHDFLVTNYPDLVGEQTTRELESRMDSIENGKESYERLMNELYEKLRSAGLLEEKGMLTSIKKDYLEEALA
ncbi:MAG: reverse gyrase [Fervidicoccaceae archaeon]